MPPRTDLQSFDRATRFPLHVPVYFRELDSRKWLHGTTENISYTGILFRSLAPLLPETELSLRVQLPVRTKGLQSAEVRCKAKVVRVEPSQAQDRLTALAVAISEPRILRRAESSSCPKAAQGD